MKGGEGASDMITVVNITPMGAEIMTANTPTVVINILWFGLYQTAETLDGELMIKTFPIALSNCPKNKNEKCLLTNNLERQPKIVRIFPIEILLPVKVRMYPKYSLPKMPLEDEQHKKLLNTLSHK